MASREKPMFQSFRHNLLISWGSTKFKCGAFKFKFKEIDDGGVRGIGSVRTDLSDSGESYNRER